MKKIVFYFLFTFLAVPLCDAKTEIDKAFTRRTKSGIKDFMLYSPDIYEGRQILEDQVYNGSSCNGKNISPKLIWRNPPAGTKSFAITMYDKDANTGSGWWHWLVYNIPADVSTIDVGASSNRKLMPKGVMQGINDYGFKGYGGPCPPAGSKHNYTITIYALDIEKLDVSRNATPAMVSLHMIQHKLASATIKAFYKRNADVVYKGANGRNEEMVIYKKTNPNTNNKAGITKNNRKNLSENKASKNKNNNVNSNNKAGSTKKNAIVEVKE